MISCNTMVTNHSSCRLCKDTGTYSSWDLLYTGCIYLITVDHLEVRLVGGSIPAEGRLEVLYDGEWGSVCDDGVNKTVADIVCSMMNYR